MKKILILYILSILFNANCYAQFSYGRLTENKKYSKALKKAEKRYNKNSNDVSVNYDLSVIFSLNDYKSSNLDTAYYFAHQAMNLYAKTEKTEKLNKNNLTSETLQNLILNICKKAYKQSVEKNTIKDYNKFIRKFIDNEDLTEDLIKRRNKLAYEHARATNTTEAYQNFIDTYPDADEIYEAKQNRNKLAFLKAKEINTIESYQNFIDTYSDADEVMKAIDLRDNLAFNNAVLTENSNAFKEFISKYPDSKLYSKAIFERDKYSYYENIIPDNIYNHINFLENNKNSKYKTVICDSLFNISKRKKSFLGLHYLIKNLDKDEISDSLWFHYYKVFTSDGYISTYNAFQYMYSDDFPFMNKLYSEYEIAQTLDDLEFTKGYQKHLKKKYVEYISKAGDKYTAYRLMLMIIKPYMDKKQWKTALNVVKEYRAHFGESNKYINDLIEILTLSDRNIKPKNIGYNLNTKKGGEYVPVISADNKLLYFCGKGRKDNYSGEDIYVSEKVKGYWQKPKLIEDLSTWGNDAPLSISTDGNRLLTFKNGDLYYSDQTYYGWDDIIPFPTPVNSDVWDADAVITSDGKAILFSSIRDDINKGKGVDLLTYENTDIYVCLKIDDGWSEPINLGEKINTRYTDRQAYLHSDMKTLYFSSDGHGGLGGLDVYKVTRLSDTSWTEWSDPINMGKEINSTGEDWGYKISTDGNLAYFAAHNSGENDIYTIELPIYLRPGYVATISGKLVDKDKNPIESTIRWEDLKTGKIIGESKSNPKDGAFFIVLPLGKKYGYFIDKEEYFPISNNIDLTTENKPIEIDENIEMVAFKEMKEEGTAVSINNLFFNVNKHKLLPESIPELKRVAEIIKSNNLKVEISGHTDNTGTDEHNQELSENRAKAVRDFLVSLGVSKELLTIIGYGDTKPIATNDTEKGRALNRRVELKFVN